MNFVEGVVAFVLLALALGGSYAAIMSLVRRTVELPPYKAEGRSALLLALLYFAGAAVALIAFLLLFLSGSS